jgi:hypothetical protein
MIPSPNLRPVPDVHKRVAPSTTIDISTVVSSINARLRNRPEDFIEIGRQLDTIWSLLRKKDWKKYGFLPILTYEVASQLRQMPGYPEMIDPDNLKRFPCDLTTMIAVLQMVKQSHDTFEEAMEEAWINPEVGKHDIRFIRKFGKPKDVIHKERHEAAVNNPQFSEGNQILTGRFQDLLPDALEDNSTDLFVVDPPWAKETIEEFGDAAEIAQRKLKTGGFLMAYTGHNFLDAKLQAMSLHLTYFWIFAVEHEPYNKPTNARRHVGNLFQPIAVYVKGYAMGFPHWIVDLRKGDQDKSHHAWGIGTEEIKYYIEHMTDPGALVVDCCAGGGTVSVVCQKILKDRKCLACEINPETAALARRRVEVYPDLEQST